MESLKKTVINIISPSQFGYLVDYYEYSNHLRVKYRINYYCLDEGKPKIEMEGVEVIYIKSTLKGFRKWINFSRSLSLFSFEDEVVFVKYYRFCSILRLVIKKPKKLILDIRTGSVGFTKLSRFLFNYTLMAESMFFDVITIISESLAKYLHVNNYILLPLGSPPNSIYNKNFDDIRMIYIGTLSNRKIEDTLYGLKQYLEIRSEEIKINYEIIGDGYNNEVEHLKALASRLRIDEYVTIHGRLPYNQLKPHFDKSNLGVSYIPITPYYNVQPVTKTLEYISHGMIVLGTKTEEQQKLINDTNGLLCNDSSESFSEALSFIAKRLNKYNSAMIKSKSIAPSWEEVSEYLDENIISLYT
ncbi:glycosyltransferase [Endozoicomonas ascidiicola]|uniref:glycosyltransferase n=1 Tax=Endozoicomonas ascidiicola TaxID=1698521 RepID=UPI00082A7F4F|nr:glycosyltransferase [Endozoicomonas ascidiicola]